MLKDAYFIYFLSKIWTLGLNEHTFLKNDKTSVDILDSRSFYSVWKLNCCINDIDTNIHLKYVNMIKNSI